MLTKSMLRIALLAVLFVLIQATRSLALTTGNIQGKVTDQNGNPLAGVRVAVTSPSQSQTTTTNRAGFYSILNLSPDTYSVTASKDGFDTATVYGITVTADQTSQVNIVMRPAIKTIGHITTTATATIVSRTVTGDLYAVNAQAIGKYQGAAGGSETLYSQNSVVGSLPGVVRLAGTGGGYFGQGSLSMRGGQQDQIGYEFDGIELNRGFDFYNATSFVTNGLGSLEVYTGGAPASAGRAMSGYINAIPQRGHYPGGADFTGVLGAPDFNHTAQADVYGGTPDNRFTYYISTLAINAAYDFGQRGNLDNTTLVIPAGDPNCGAVAAIYAGNGLSTAFPCTPSGRLASTQAVNLPVSIGSYFSNPYATIRDTVANLHWSLSHNGLNDDIQALYLTGLTESPNFYAGQGVDPNASGAPNFGVNGGPFTIDWPVGTLYQGQLGAPYDPTKNLLLTWPSSGGSDQGPVPPNYLDGFTTKYSIEKVGYTRAMTENSFLNIYGYMLYSDWLIDSATNSNNNGIFYQLHDNATGVTLNYQNQLNDHNLLKFTADYIRDVTLRYNYANYITQQRYHGALTEPGGRVVCGAPGALATFGPFDPGCTGAIPEEVVLQIKGPYAYWNNVNPLNYDGVISDQFRPSDKWLFDIGARYDIFGFQLMPLTINGPNGIAEQSQNQFGICLFGYKYAPSEPCNGYLTKLATANGQPGFLPGAAPWQDVSGTLQYRQWSPRLGITYSAGPGDVFRFSAGRYVQPPNGAFEEYRAAPYWGVGDTVSILNRFYAPATLHFTAVHNILPEDSTNYDLSWEHNFGGDVSAKITPYYRITRNQVVTIPVDPSNPTFVTGSNVGAERVKGVEFYASKPVQGENGLGGTISATYTDAKLRFNRNAYGVSFIDVVNQQIAAYNAAHGTNYPMQDVNGYYSPSYSMAPTDFSPSYDVKWVIGLNLDWRFAGFDLTPTFNYQSGSPYGEPLLFPDPSGLVAFGPDPYTGQFDQIGSLKGPSSWTMNLGLSHNIGHNVMGSILWTNVFTAVHNQGYPWEYNPRYQVVSYSDNIFYQVEPLGLDTGNATSYNGVNYFPYAPSGLQPYKSIIFSLSLKT